MIIVHSYCSYKHSPSGFVYGSFVVDETNNTDYYLSDSNNAEIVQIAFENGIIRRLCGKRPDSESFIFLVRKLKYNYGNDYSDIGREVQMNLGFEFDSSDEFLSFVCGFCKTEESDAPALYKQLADCVIPDKSVEPYNYRISKRIIDSWIDSIKQPLSNDENKQFSKYKNRIYITAASSSTDYTEEIRALFSFPDSINGRFVEFCREESSPKYYYPHYSQKKKNIQQNGLAYQKKRIQLLVLIVLVLIILSLLLLIFCSANKKTQTAMTHETIVSYSFHTLAVNSCLTLAP